MIRSLALAGAIAAGLMNVSATPASALDCDWCEHVYDNCVRSGLVAACAAQYVQCQQSNCTLGDLSNRFSTVPMSQGGFSAQRH